MKAGVRATYKVAEQWAKEGRPYTNAEFVTSLILATVQDSVQRKLKFRDQFTLTVERKSKVISLLFASFGWQ
jgi:hypothetical protein